MAKHTARLLVLFFAARLAIFTAMAVVTFSLAMTYSMMSTGSLRPSAGVVAAWLLITTLGTIGVTIFLIRTDTTTSRVATAATNAAGLLTVFTGGFLVVTWAFALLFALISHLRTGVSPWLWFGDHLTTGWKATIVSWVVMSLLSWASDESRKRRGRAGPGLPA